MFELPVQASRPFEIACLGCGAVRISGRTGTGRLDSPECRQCGYLGWSECSGRPFLTTFDEWRLAEPSLGSPTV